MAWSLILLLAALLVTASSISVAGPRATRVGLRVTEEEGEEEGRFDEERASLPPRPGLGLPALKGQEIPATGAYERQYWYWYERSLPNGVFPHGAEQRARREADQFRTRASAALTPHRAGAPLPMATILQTSTWTEMGPAGMTEAGYGLPLCSGRITAILLQKAQDRILIGSASGGIWKSPLSTGPAFTPRSDSAPSLAIGCLAADPNNANILYAGTGEPGVNIDALTGSGLLKSTDGGDTWARVDQNVFTGVSLSQVWVDPANSSRVLVSVANHPTLAGLYQSTNGGQTFPTKLAAGGGIGFAVSPANSQRMLYSMTEPFGSSSSDLLLSTNGGSSFSPVNGPWKNGSNVGRIDIAWAPSDGNKVWCSVAPPITGSNSKAGVYLSSDGGATWTTNPVVSFQTSGNGEGQAWYGNAIAVYPNNPNQVYLGGVSLYRATSAGVLTKVAHWYSGTGVPAIHADQHAIAFDPTDSNTCFFGNDGGLFYTTNNAGAINHFNTGLGTTQFYAGAVGPSGFNSLIGGAQDNGTLGPSFPVGQSLEWDQLIGGDGFQCAVDPSNENVMYGSYVNCTYYISSNLGASFTQLASLPLLGGESPPFISPLTIDPSDGSKIYAGAQRVYRGTSNRTNSVSWAATSSSLLFSGDTIRKIAVAKSDGNTIYASGGSHLKRTTTGGDPWSASIEPSGGQFITGIAVNPTNASDVVISRSGYSNGHVVRSTTGGSSWTDVTSNLPNVPANAVAVRVNGGQLDTWVATDTGVYYADLNAASVTWTPMGTGLPNVSCADVFFANGGSTLLVATHGRGMWNIDVPQAALTVTAPNGGETVVLGATTSITWQSSGFSAGHTVKLELSRDGGSTYSEVIAASAPDIGQYTWTPGGATSTTCRVKVTSNVSTSVFDASNANFTLSTGFSISGTITDGTNPLVGVTVTAGSRSAQTAGDGTYTITGLAPATYTVTPALAEYTFSPTSTSVTVGPSKTGINFTGTVVTYTISGTVTANSTGLVGVLVQAGSKSATTAANGTYTITGLVAGTYTVTPSKTEYDFAPTSTSVSVGPSKTGVNFTGTQRTYTISGTVTANSTGLAGVLVSAGAQSATTAADGSYTITGLTANTYTVTPTKTEYDFAPTSTSVTVGTSKSGINFVGTQRTYTISGTVTANSVGLAGVQLQAGAQSATTAANGTYTISGLTAGTYTVTPGKAEYTFAPASSSITVGGSKTGVNFTGTVVTYTISGTVTANSTGLAGVLVSAGAQSATTAADGSYTIAGLAAGTYTVTPSKAEYDFAPTSSSVAVGPSKTGINFTGTQRTYTISGTVTANSTGLAGVLVQAEALSATTAADGTYTISGLTAGTYSVTPGKAEYTFSPAGSSITVGPSKTGVNFAGTVVTYTISGTVTVNSAGLAGVLVQAGAQSATTGANGTYTITGLVAGAYTVTPSKTEYDFSPATASVTVGPSKTGVDFTGAAKTYTISGTVTSGGNGLAGVLISAGSQSATTAADGTYTVSGLVAGAYTVTPTKSEYTFAPVSTSVTVGPNKTGINFTGTAATYTISGTVTANSVGLAGVLVQAGAQSATTAANGTYTIGGLTAGTYTVTPSKAEYAFTPASASTTVGPSKTGVNFAATALTYSISGTIGSGGNGLPGVLVSAGALSATTAADGTYTISGLTANTYTITPTKAEFDFAPASTGVTVGPSKTGIDFTGTQRTYTISGTVTANSTGLAGVLVQAGAQSATTIANGTYTISGLVAGAYTVTAAKTEYDFLPASTSVTVGPNKTGINFTGTVKTYTITGFVTSGGGGIPGVIVMAGAQSVSTGVDGSYTLSGLVAGTYVVTPAKTEYDFTPGNANVTVGPSKTGINFAGTQRTYTVSGTITFNSAGMSGVVVTAGGQSTTTAGNGTYTLTGLVAGTYSVVPSLASFGFTPGSRTVTVGPNQTGIDFTATSGFSIAGTVTSGSSGLGGVSVAVGDLTATTASNGVYSLTSVAAGTYTVTPTLAGYVFTPASRQVTLGPNQSGINFTATRVFSVSGTVRESGAPLAGATVSIGQQTALSGSDGTYIVSGLAAGSYSVSVAKAAYVFSPVSQSVVLGPDRTGIDFAGTHVFSISGRVTQDGSGLQGVMVTAGAATATTAADGTYTLAGLPPGGYTVTPTRSHFSFSPATRSVTLGPDQANVDFTGSPAYSISGKVAVGSAGLAGVTVSAGALTVTTTSTGTYTLSPLAPGQYTVSAQKSGYAFTPTNKTVTLGPDAVNVNFTAKQVFTITGTVTAGGSPLAGVAIKAGAFTTSTAGDGTYTLANLPAASYTVIPALASYGFSPASKAVTVGPSRASINFAASAIVVKTLTFSPATAKSKSKVTGTVTLNVATSAAISVALSSANPAVAPVPASVTVPAGKNAATFTFKAGRVTATTPVGVTATYGGSSKTGTVKVKK